jgi:hypothetical protein
MISLLVILTWLLVLPAICFAIGFFAKGTVREKLIPMAWIMSFEFICLLPLRSFCMTRGIKGIGMTDVSRYTVTPKSFVMAAFFMVFLGGFISGTIMAGCVVRGSEFKTLKKLEIIGIPALAFAHFAVFMTYTLMAAFDFIPH